MSRIENQKFMSTSEKSKELAKYIQPLMNLHKKVLY